MLCRSCHIKYDYSPNRGINGGHNKGVTQVAHNKGISRYGTKIKQLNLGLKQLRNALKILMDVIYNLKKQIFPDMIINLMKKRKCLKLLTKNSLVF